MKAERPRSIGAIQKRPKLYFLLPAAPDPTHGCENKAEQSESGRLEKQREKSAKAIS